MKLANTKNLKPWKPGQSGNPAGRAKSRPFSDALKAEIEAAEGDPDVLRLIARSLLDKAQEGDIAAINSLVDRLDGKPTNLTILPLEKAISEMSPEDAIKSVTDCVAQGELPPQQGQQIITMIEARIKAVELVEIESRLTELENSKT